MTTRPTCTARPPETSTREEVETHAGGPHAGRRETRRLVTYVAAATWPCSACGEVAVVDVGSGACRACWRVLVLAPWARFERDSYIAAHSEQTEELAARTRTSAAWHALARRLRGQREWHIQAGNDAVDSVVYENNQLTDELATRTRERDELRQDLADARDGWECAAEALRSRDAELATRTRERDEARAATGETDAAFGGGYLLTGEEAREAPATAPADGGTNERE